MDDGYLMVGDQGNYTTVPPAAYGLGQVQEHEYESDALNAGPRAAPPAVYDLGQAQEQEHEYEYGALTEPTDLAPTPLNPEQPQPQPQQPMYLSPTPLGAQPQQQPQGEAQYAEVGYATPLGAQLPLQQGEPQYAAVEYSQIGSPHPGSATYLAPVPVANTYDMPRGAANSHKYDSVGIGHDYRATDTLEGQAVQSPEGFDYRNPAAATAATGMYSVPTMAPENQPATVMLQGFSIPTANI